MSEKPVNTNEIEQTSTAPNRIPLVDIYEKEETITVVADMPGVDESNLKIDFEKGILTIQGEVVTPNTNNYRPVLYEYKSLNYRRSFSVPEEIDVEKISAVVKNGVVTISLPRSPKPKARKIPITVG